MAFNAVDMQAANVLPWAHNSVARVSFKEALVCDRTTNNRMDWEYALRYVLDDHSGDQYNKEGSAAWTKVCDGIAAKRIVVGSNALFLQKAVLECTASVVQRLLELGVPAKHTKDGRSLMHLAMQTRVHKLEKCKLLAPSDLAHCTSTRASPVMFCVRDATTIPVDFHESMEVLRWMAAQPECPITELETVYSQLQLRSLLENKPNVVAAMQVLADAIAGRQRWSALRAAWVGVVGAAGGAGGA